MKTLFFEDCISLSSIKFPDSLKQIDTRAFYGTNLENVSLTKSIRKLGANVLFLEIISQLKVYPSFTTAII